MRNKNIYNFIDESGNADFFGKRGKELWTQDGWQPLLIMGLVQTNDRKKIGQEITEFHKKILDDQLYIGITSLKNDEHFFHARTDHPEIRAEFFQFLRKRDDFICYCLVTQKNPSHFSTDYGKNTNKFYFDCVRKLLDICSFEKGKNHLFYLSQRNNTTKEKFTAVLQEALCMEMVQDELDYKAQVVKSSEYPELCVIDYILWAVQRSILKDEHRFLNAISGKIAFICIEDLDKVYKKYTISEYLDIIRTG